MPSPVEALPWGSRSPTRTFSPIAASAVPRLIAVVVLPTPPFWLASASTRGGSSVPVGQGNISVSAISILSGVSRQRPFSAVRSAPFGPSNQHDASSRTRLAGHQFGLDIPISRGLGQFSPYILPFGKQPLCTPFQ